MNNTVRTVVIMIVASVWAINFTAPIFVVDYKPSPELNVAFMAIIGILTASYKLEKNEKTDNTSNKIDTSTKPDPKSITDGSADEDTQ